MSKVTRLIRGMVRSVTVDAEVSISASATSAVVTFPATLQTGNSSPKVSAWMTNTTDSNPQFQPITITARSSTGFTATWNAPTATANYNLSYIVEDGFVT